MKSNPPSYRRETPSSSRSNQNMIAISEELSLHASKALLKAKLEGEASLSKTSMNLREKNYKNLINMSTSPQK
jgi:hypothetical protein